MRAKRIVIRMNAADYARCAARIVLWAYGGWRPERVADSFPWPSLSSAAPRLRQGCTCAQVVGRAAVSSCPHVGIGVTVSTNDARFTCTGTATSAELLDQGPTPELFSDLIACYFVSVAGLYPSRVLQHAEARRWSRLRRQAAADGLLRWRTVSEACRHAVARSCRDYR